VAIFHFALDLIDLWRSPTSFLIGNRVHMCPISSRGSLSNPNQLFVPWHVVNAKGQDRHKDRNKLDDSTGHNLVTRGTFQHEWL